MKLILKEYLSSLREREELDVILPDLLSQMRLTVFSKPKRGYKEHGVDVAAYGSIDREEKKVFLLSIKRGDLTRNSWDGKADQSLRPSLNEIKDFYIPNLLPKRYKGKKIVICLCIGGEVQKDVLGSVEGYCKENSTESIIFDVWNGDKIAGYITDYFLREDLLFGEYRSLLRKSLAFVDEPDISFKHFSRLIFAFKILLSENEIKPLTIIRQMNLSLWVLYSWCRNADNLESAYLSAERTLLFAWDIYKKCHGKNNKFSKDMQKAFMSLLRLYDLITSSYLDIKIIPHANKLFAISHAVQSFNDIDVNIKLFDVIGRISLRGLWNHWFLSLLPIKKRNEIQQDVLVQRELDKSVSNLIDFMSRF